MERARLFVVDGGPTSTERRERRERVEEMSPPLFELAPSEPRCAVCSGGHVTTGCPHGSASSLFDEIERSARSHPSGGAR